jgi:hypothetical protein
MQRNNQFGFTIFEITFAVVIVGLLGIVTVIGQDVAINSQVSRLERDFHSVQTAIYDSHNWLRSTRNEARKASLHFQDSSVFGNNNSLNAILGGNWNSTSGAVFELWKKVRPTGFVKSSMDTHPDTYVPLRSSGSVIVVPETHSELIAGLEGNYIICTDNIAGRLVKKLDLVMDDGNTASGSMRVSKSIGDTGIATDSIVNGATYMVCLGGSS